MFIPPEGRPEGWNDGGFRTPVVRLRKALYGHPDSGGFWEEHCNERLSEAGFKPIEAWPSCFWHERLKLMLSVYVDDFKLAGPKKYLNDGWALIRKHIQMEGPTPMQLYIGFTHKRVEGKIDDGCPVVVGIYYDMESCLASCVQRYSKLCEPSSARTGASTRPSKTLSTKQKKTVAPDDQPDVDPSK